MAGSGKDAHVGSDLGDDGLGVPLTHPGDGVEVVAQAALERKVFVALYRRGSVP